MDDLISRKAAIDALAEQMPQPYTPDGSHPADKGIFMAQEIYADCIQTLEDLPPAQPDNQVHLCDSCSYTYPECPSVYTNMIFGNGTGNDNICACSKYMPPTQPEPCEDAVSRADILSMIDDMADDVRDGFGFAYEQWKEQAEELPPVTPKQRWIPVTERLPDNSRNVLITHRGGVSMAWYNGLYFEKGASTHHQKIKTVTAWCELPEPYQKGDAE